MTKKEALRQFKESTIDFEKMLIKHPDKVALAWDWETDYLCKEGLITKYQYDTWTNPFRKG